MPHGRSAELTIILGPAVDPTSSNTNSGPHSSDLANKTDLRVDSDNDKTTSGPHSSDAANKVDPRVDSDNSKTGSTGPIGGSSWMSTALPHREGKDNTTANTAVSGTTSQHPSDSNEHTGLEDIKSQPPNVLPTNVPTGTSTDFGAPDSTTSDVAGASSAAATSSVPSSSTNTTTKIPDETVGSSAPSTTEPSHSLTGSRGSIAPEKPDYTDSPLKPAEKGSAHAVNPDAIPLAGGKKVGEDAYVERKSMQVDSIDAGLPATTSSNTARNVGTAEATGRPSTTLSEPEQPSVTSGSSESEHKEKKSLKEKIKEKVHIHKHDK